ncbi:MAG TPA: hypothetical protein VKZ94_05645 [Advenella sp.]|nr:hypothetical protein [Advenella sp.]
MAGFIAPGAGPDNQPDIARYASASLPWLIRHGGRPPGGAPARHPSVPGFLSAAVRMPSALS